MKKRSCSVLMFDWWPFTFRDTFDVISYDSLIDKNVSFATIPVISNTVIIDWQCKN